MNAATLETMLKQMENFERFMDIQMKATLSSQQNALKLGEQLGVALEAIGQLKSDMAQLRADMALVLVAIKAGTRH